jgi:hypothetical protein
LFAHCSLIVRSSFAYISEGRAFQSRINSPGVSAQGWTIKFMDLL